MAQRTQRSKITVEVAVETHGLSSEEHSKRVRWVYRNMLNTNGDIRDTFFVAAVRDEGGNLLEFQGAGHGKPSQEIRDVLTSYMDEGANSKKNSD